MKGLVTKSTGLWYEVIDENQQVISCRLRGKFRIEGIKNTNPVVVGDHVEFDPMEDGTGYITQIDKRKNYIDRKSTKLSKISHLIASNIDRAFLVVTLNEPRTSLGFIDRFLVAAEGFRIPVTLLFNKIDLYDEENRAIIKQVAEMYESVGYHTLLTSVITKAGMEQLRDLMSGHVCMFSGHSGVGKSALINSVFPNLNLKVGEISDYHKKGKHTTTFAQMYPVDKNSFIIDTPGIKEFGLIEYSKEEIRDYFPEIRKYNNCCKFSNCTHIHEPGCAVIKAVEEGLIPSSRYLNYLAIVNDDDMNIADWQLL
jgi:ribosome biogenesis GTPase